MGYELDVDDDTVAAFRMPIPVALLAGMSALLETAYGHGLRMTQRGEFLVVFRSDEARMSA